MHKAMTIIYVTCYLDVSGVTRLNLDILSRIALDAVIHVCTTSDDDCISDKWDDNFTTFTRDIFKLCRLPQRERYRCFVEYLQRHCIDIVYATHSLWLYEHAARLKRDLPKVKIVDSLHVLEPYCFRGGYPDISANRFVHPYIDASILISRNLENYIYKNYQVDHDKYHVIHNGINAHLFSGHADSNINNKFFSNNSTRMVGFIGRFTAQKRPLLFVDIAYKLSNKYPFLKYYMVGNGPLLDSVFKRIRKLGLFDQIRLLPSQSDIASLLRETDVLVMPSSYEGAPLTILEALAVGTPVVASDVGAVREYVSGNCRLIPLGFAGIRERELYVSAVEQSLSDRDRSSILEPEHDIVTVAASYRSVFLKVLGQNLTELYPKHRQ
jgi:glycosyltransferase involved in cell wall biosynthesis